MAIVMCVCYLLSLCLPLYSKGDYDGAITQYKLTIGTLEPSYVIRKVKYTVYMYMYCIADNLVGGKIFVIYQLYFSS